MILYPRRGLGPHFTDGTQARPKPMVETDGYPSLDQQRLDHMVHVMDTWTNASR